jgi:Asp-tRNA(Asn)/Glu-tRNA(Gln) amidotransferase A subunit family amidase
MVNVDEQFLKERSEIFSNVELEFEKRRSEEALFNEPIKSLSANRTLLEKIEEECTSKTRDVARRKEVEVKRLSSNVEGLREEQDRVARMKTGIFRGLSKKAKAKKETEVTQRLSLAEKELASAEQNFAADQERLRHEYEKRKQPVIEQIRAMEKEVEKQDVDGSLETRKAACEALINAVNALVKRKANQTI